MTIVRKFGFSLAAAAVGFGLLGISAPAHAQAVKASSTVTSGTHKGVTAFDITWGTGGGKTFTAN